MKEIRIKDKYFKQYLQVFYGGTLKELCEDYDIMDIYNGETQGQFIGLGTSNMIWLSDINNIPVLVHELSHFLFDNFERKKINPLNDLGEVFCYGIEFYLNEILKKIGKTKA